MLTSATCACSLMTCLDGWWSRSWNSKSTGRSKRLKLPISFGCEIKVAFREAVDLVRPDLDFAFAPRQIKIGVMAFSFCDGSDLVHKGKRLSKILERVQTF